MTTPRQHVYYGYHTEIIIIKNQVCTIKTLTKNVDDEKKRDEQCKFTFQPTCHHRLVWRLRFLSVFFCCFGGRCG